MVVHDVCAWLRCTQLYFDKERGDSFVALRLAVRYAVRVRALFGQ